ncbi:hypothetical protein SAMN05444340_11377 [Citreimonas salinaria]|uniref:Uncharacterized protein n=2 Tax=Citreimonas salinaria TaxID=321339 RepID=A0A1H3LMR6_9RHOB|nr:hypothetical protein SAMN05444340_11377 [Citreimonas salinaria]
MQNFLNGRLPRHDPDAALIEELSAIIKTAITQRDRWRGIGLWIPFRWAVDVMDDDPDLARRVLTAAGFTPRSDGKWTWSKVDGWGLHKVADVAALRAVFEDALDFHRPL